MEPFSISAEYYQQMADKIRDRAGHFAAAAAEIIRESDGDLDLTINTMNGLPEKEIVELAEEWGADLIVVGSHGLTVLSKLSGERHKPFHHNSSAPETNSDDSTRPVLRTTNTEQGA